MIVGPAEQLRNYRRADITCEMLTKLSCHGTRVRKRDEAAVIIPKCIIRSPLVLSSSFTDTSYFDNVEWKSLEPILQRLLIA
jgi:hypothetical protein